MRYGLLADIHANLSALQAAVAGLRRAGIDRFLCAGDLVGYGPEPNECVDLIAGLDAVCVAGNHDLIALERLSDERCIPLARNSLAWTRANLREDVRAYLAALPAIATAEGGVVLAHGSLDDPQEYVTRPDQADAQLALASWQHPDVRALVLGHTHRAGYFRRGGVRMPEPPRPHVGLEDLILLNPGSVGQSRDSAALARCAVLDLEQRTASFLELEYDVEATRRALRQAGLPGDSCHLRPTALDVYTRPLRRWARSGVRAVRFAARSAVRA